MLNEKIDLGVIKRRQAEARKRFVPIASDNRAMKMLEHVDFDLLEDIFRQLAERCNADSGQINIIKREDVYVIYGYGENSGEYRQEPNMIGINTEMISGLALSDRAKQLYVLELITHEIAHAISITRLSDFDEKKKVYRERRSGLSVSSKEFFGSRFSGLDEAFTELIVKDVVSEYLERSGWMTESEADEIRKPLPETEFGMGEKISRFLQSVGLPPIVGGKTFRASYTNEILLVNQLMDYLKKLTGVSRETVYQAFVREKIEGNTDHVTDWQRIFVETLGEERGGELFHRMAIMTPRLKESREMFQETLTKLSSGQSAEADRTELHSARK